MEAIPFNTRYMGVEGTRARGEGVDYQGNVTKSPKLAAVDDSMKQTGISVNAREAYMKMNESPNVMETRDFLGRAEENTCEWCGYKEKEDRVGNKECTKHTAVVESRLREGMKRITISLREKATRCSHERRRLKFR